MPSWIRPIAFASLAAVLSAAPNFLSAQAFAADEFTVTVRNHKFEPAELRVPSGTRVTLTVVNDDPTPEEFESHALKVEKVIPGKSKATVRFGPLKAGRYEFEGEFHSATAKGVVIAE